MSPEDWFEALARHLPDATTVDEDERVALLDLARVAAHSSERWTAPVTTYLVGVALADVPAAERAARVRALVDALEPPATA
jgi:hypothetical protein